MRRPRKPPTVEEVSQCQWWWNFPNGAAPHVMQFDVSNGQIIHADLHADHGSIVFSPEDWPGEWAPCSPPEKQEDVLCNLCGFTCALESDWDEEGGLIKAVVCGGYNSTPGNGHGALDDSTSYQFSICEFCLDWLFGQFVLPVAASDNMESEVWKPAAERVAADDWRKMKNEFFAESSKRANARKRIP